MFISLSSSTTLFLLKPCLQRTLRNACFWTSTDTSNTSQYFGVATRLLLTSVCLRLILGLMLTSSHERILYFHNPVETFTTPWHPLKSGSTTHLPFDCCNPIFRAATSSYICSYNWSTECRGFEPLPLFSANWLATSPLQPYLGNTPNVTPTLISVTSSLVLDRLYKLWHKGFRQTFLSYLHLTENWASGIWTHESRSQSPVPYRLAIAQRLIFLCYFVSPPESLHHNIGL